VLKTINGFISHEILYINVYVLRKTRICESSVKVKKHALSHFITVKYYNCYELFKFVCQLVLGIPACLVYYGYNKYINVTSYSEQVHFLFMVHSYLTYV